ncbi:MAG: hypothetical protein L6R38_009583 [Xanthoria sp. 2 TBL-2021]|nr:MAG: hypothetical protein L6R38_009583 [Xanthoria sp. 2 TBL-2021]
MAEGNPLIQQLDAGLEQLFAGWNIYTTLLCIGLVTYLVYPIFFTRDPDTHPLLLARQSSPSYVRQPGESAVYRSLETPLSYPLKSGLNVKEPGAPRWAAGKDGDLRDVWRKAARGPIDDEGKPTGEPGKIYTVLGREGVTEHRLSDVTKEINAVGEYLVQHGAKRVAIYVPNSMEFLVTLFASSFYGFIPVIVPQEQSSEALSDMLKTTHADTLITAAGSVPLQGLLEQHFGLKQVIWVVERTSRHMDWNEVPEGVGGRAEIAVWHDIVEERKSLVSTDLPKDNADKPPSNLIAVSQSASKKKYDVVEFTQHNIVAAIAAQISVLPRPHRMNPSDLLLSLAPLTSSYPLTIALAALYSNASLALTSVSGDKVPYDAAFRRVKPTVVIVAPPTIREACETFREQTRSILQKYAIWQQTKSLAEGMMRKLSSEPRLIYTFESSENLADPLTLAELGDLRLLTGARTAYAFTDARVAGAIAQTSIYDYRRSEDAKQAAFGGPLSSVEFKLVDENGHKNSDEKALGKLVVTGPAVVGGETKVDRFMTMTDFNTLAYA